MAISLDQVLAVKRSLEDDYRDRHEAQKKLRDYWHGRYWQQADQATRGSITSIFQDIGTRNSEVGPDVKLVHNVLQEVCVKFQTFLSPLPMIDVYVDPPESATRRAQATKKERALYGAWGEGRMNLIANKMGWYLPLMGDCFLGIHPDFDRSIPRPMLRSPECAYPVPSFDGMSLGAVVFHWKVRESVAAREFPGYQPQAKKTNLLQKIVPNRSGQTNDPEIDVYEWSDNNEWARWVNGQKTNGVEHNYGFNLYEQVKFIDVPDEPWGHGAVEQAVNLNEMGNALYSLLFQSVLENVFPRLVLIDPSKAPEEIDVGPGAVIPINAGGSVEWLHPPTAAIGSQVGFLQQNEQNIQRASSMTDANFGVANNSIITGKAINSLQGAGAGNTVEMVQGCGIGRALEMWNEKALFMFQTLFKGDQIKLGGLCPSTAYDVKGRMFSMTFKGSEIVGSQRNELTFMPNVSMHDKIVMGLQMAGGGLVSKKWQRAQVGISDSEAMDEEIVGEAIQDGIVGAILQDLQQPGAEQNAVGIEDRAFAQLQGGTAPPAAPAAPSSGPPAGPPPTGPLAAPPSGPPPQGLPVSAPGAAAPPAALPPAPAPSPAGAGQASSSQTVSLNDVAGAIQNLGGLSGRVFLVGEIVQRGQTDSDIEIALTSPDDQQPVAQALSQWQTRLVFHTIQGEPQEPFLEVTPGKPPRQGGGGPGGQQGGPPAPTGTSTGYPLPSPVPKGQSKRGPVIAGVTQ